MDITNPQRAKVLVHALPYIQEYSGKIVVIKYGGNAMISEKLKDSVMRDIVLLSLIGVQVVLVHGGGPEITDMLQKLGKQTQFVDGLRVTDAETADVVQMVLAGKINKTLVNLIGQKGGRAIGLSGIDGQMIQARVRDERLGYVGEITKIDVRPILDVLDKGYIPVVSTVGCDTQGHVYNINADTAAARIAGELGAESLIAMTDIGGILRAHPRHPYGRGARTHHVRRHLRRHAAEGDLLHGRHPLGRAPCLYHRRTCAARHTHRNADKRRHRHHVRCRTRRKCK